jgi:hypothetical protein
VYDRLFFGQPPAPLASSPPPTAVTAEPTRILTESVHPEPDVADAADAHTRDEDD